MTETENTPKHTTDDLGNTFFSGDHAPCTPLENVLTLRFISALTAMKQTHYKIKVFIQFLLYPNYVQIDDQQQRYLWSIPPHLFCNLFLIRRLLNKLYKMAKLIGLTLQITESCYMNYRKWPKVRLKCVRTELTAMSFWYLLQYIQFSKVADSFLTVSTNSFSTEYILWQISK